MRRIERFGIGVAISSTSSRAGFCPLPRPIGPKFLLPMQSRLSVQTVDILADKRQQRVGVLPIVGGAYLLDQLLVGHGRTGLAHASIAGLLSDLPRCRSG
jgi:hypothetical protein